MAWYPRTEGYITVTAAGTPEAVATTHTPCQSIVFQQHEDNTGMLYVCNSATANKTTGVGVLLKIPAPTIVDQVAVVLPYGSVSIPSAPAAMNLLGYWVDADVSDDKCLVSYVKN